MENPSTPGHPAGMNDHPSIPDKALVGRRIDALREAFEIADQKAFADAIGVDESSYSKIKNGKKTLKTDMAFRASERFGVPMDYFYRGSFVGIDADLREKLLKILGGQNR